MSVKRIIRAIAVLAVVVGTSSAHAALSTLNTWVGHYGISSDGFGSTSNSGIISAEVPTGGVVEAAYLYSGASISKNFSGVTLNGNAISLTDIGSSSSFLWSARADVTSIVKPVIDGGAGGIYDFRVTDNNSIDGEALVVVYSLASLPEATVAILDGAQSFQGETFALNFSEPLDPSDPAFFAEMALGINFSCCNQKSNVLVNGSTLTNNAGNNDDGLEVANGSLITVGGIGDDLLNTNTYDGDDERYDLTPFVALGDTTISVFTNNPSNDDQIFLATFYLAGIVGINEPPPTEEPVPAPGSLVLLASGLALLRMGRKKRLS